jgi:hypothetical protein
MHALRPALSLCAAGVLAALMLFAAEARSATITGSGRAVTEQREAAGFTGVGLSLPGRLEIVQGEREGVTLTADDNLIGEIETVVEHGVLQVRLRSGTRARTHTRIRVTVNARTIESIAVAGSGDVVAAALQARQLAVRVSGSGDVKLGGRAETLQVRISGSGDVDAARFDSQRAKVTIAGSGDATVWARQSLEVSVSGSGDVRYFGDPAVSAKRAGSGSVRRAGASPG